MSAYETEEGRSISEKRVRCRSEREHRFRFAAGIACNAPPAVFFLEEVHFFIPAINRSSQLCILCGPPDDSSAGHFRGQFAACSHRADD